MLYLQMLFKGALLYHQVATLKKCHVTKIGIVMK